MLDTKDQKATKSHSAEIISSHNDSSTNNRLSRAKSVNITEVSLDDKAIPEVVVVPPSPSKYVKSDFQILRFCINYSIVDLLVKGKTELRPFLKKQSNWFHWVPHYKSTDNMKNQNLIRRTGKFYVQISNSDR